VINLRVQTVHVRWVLTWGDLKCESPNRVSAPSDVISEPSDVISEPSDDESEPSDN
jgi:hypothetical protein